jgi:ATP-dependent DNA helicase RecG
LSGKMVARALETVCAFANTEGGILVLGLEDPDKASSEMRIYGMSENTEALTELRRKPLTQFVPPFEGTRITTFAVRSREGSDDELVVLNVSQSAKVHSIVDDGTWLRVDSTNREMSAAEITAAGLFQAGPAALSLLDSPMKAGIRNRSQKQT